MAQKSFNLMIRDLNFINNKIFIEKRKNIVGYSQRIIQFDRNHINSRKYKINFKNINNQNNSQKVIIGKEKLKKINNFLQKTNVTKIFNLLFY